MRTWPFLKILTEKPNILSTIFVENFLHDMWFWQIFAKILPRLLREKKFHKNICFICSNEIFCENMCEPILIANACSSLKNLLFLNFYFLKLFSRRTGSMVPQSVYADQSFNRQLREIVCLSWGWCRFAHGFNCLFVSMCFYHCLPSSLHA
jgi:hypothetical protein